MDRLSPKRRSALMSRVRSKDTSPERRIRSLVHTMGFRYRLHRSDLPGSPDLVFPARRKVIFVHGCFWHGHRKCRFAKPPKSRRRYWLPKLEGNRERDQRNRRRLAHQGWKTLVIWQCQLADPLAVAARILLFLDE